MQATGKDIYLAQRLSEIEFWERLKILPFDIRNNVLDICKAEFHKGWEACEMYNDLERE